MNALRPLLIAALATVLSACVTVFPEKEPATLFRFGEDAALPASADSDAAVAVFKAPVSFARAAGGDRLLTMTGREAAYVAEARWLAPASVLFEDHLERSVLRSDGPVRLVTRSEVGKADFSLKVDVQTFEARYLSGRGVGPTVVVEARGVLVRSKDRALIADRLFRAEVPASADRVGAMVVAFDTAEGQVVKELVGWLNAEVLKGQTVASQP